MEECPVPLLIVMIASQCGGMPYPIAHCDECHSEGMPCPMAPCDECHSGEMLCSMAPFDECPSVEECPVLWLIEISASQCGGMPCPMAPRDECLPVWRNALSHGSLG